MARTSLNLDDRVVESLDRIRNATGKSISKLVSEYLLHILSRIERGESIGSTTVGDVVVKGEVLLLAEEIRNCDGSQDSMRRIERRLKNLMRYSGSVLDPETARVLEEAFLAWHRMRGLGGAGRAGAAGGAGAAIMDRERAERISAYVREIRRAFDEYRNAEGLLARRKRDEIAERINDYLDLLEEELS
jgi:hypothetical protein